MLLLVTKE